MNIFLRKFLVQNGIGSINYYLTFRSHIDNIDHGIAFRGPTMRGGWRRLGGRREKIKNLRRETVTSHQFFLHSNGENKHEVFPNLDCKIIDNFLRDWIRM